MLSAPWTEIGRLESDISDIKGSLWKYAESHKVDEVNRKLDEVNRRVDCLEYSMREFSSTLDEIQSRLQEIECKENQLKDEGVS